MQKHVSPSPPLPLSSLFLSPQPLKAPLEARRYIRSPGDLVSKESACNAGDLGVIPGLARSPREGKGYPLQNPGLENSMAFIVHGVAKSRTRLSGFHFHCLLVDMKAIL